MVSGGRSAIRRITLFDPAGYLCRIAAECDFDPAAAGLTPREVRRADRYVQFALAAADEAVRDSLAGVGAGAGAGAVMSTVDRDRIAVTLGSAVGGTMRLEEEYVVASDHGRHWVVDPSHALPFLYEALVPSQLAAEVA